VADLTDLALERAVLASVFTHGADAFVDAADVLTPKSLTDPTHQTMWACAARVLGEDPRAHLDYPTLLSAARAMGVETALSRPEDLAVVRAVFNLPVKVENTRRLAGRLRKLEFARDALAVVDSVRDDLTKLTGDESIEAILAGIENPVLDIASLLISAGSTGPQSVGAGLRDYAAHLAVNRRDVVGIPSGYRHYDRAIGGGFRRGTVNVIGARPKVGKSLLATNIGIRVASGCGYDFPNFPPTNGIPVLQLDTEMTREDQWVRQMACASGVGIDDIETGRFAADPWLRSRVDDAVGLFERWPYEFQSIAGQPFEETEANIRRWLTKRVGLNDDGSAKDCLVIFDYLKLMDSAGMASKNLSEFQVLGFMMTRLHNLAVKFKVPILTFIQLNREGISVEDASVASGSDRIVWLCSNFSIYKKQSDEEIVEQAGGKEVYNRKLVPVAQRHGAGLDDGDYVHVMSHGAVARIVEGPTRNELARGISAGPGSGSGGIVLDDTTGQESVPFAAA
jgi:replicative DNA helicase